MASCSSLASRSPNPRVQPNQIFGTDAATVCCLAAPAAYREKTGPGADVFTDAAMSGRTNWEMSPPDWLHPVKGRRFEELNSDLTSRPRLHPTRLRTKSGPDRRDP